MRDFELKQGPAFTVAGWPVRLFYAKLPRAACGFVGKYSDTELVIVLNRKDSRERHLKTLAHEITHIVRGDIENDELTVNEIEAATRAQEADTLAHIQDYLDPDLVE